MHPLGTDLSKLTDEELTKKYSELQKRFQQAYKFGPQGILPQIQMLLDDYQSELSRRQQKVYNDMMAKAESKGKGFSGIIDIS